MQPWSGPQPQHKSPNIMIAFRHLNHKYYSDPKAKFFQTRDTHTVKSPDQPQTEHNASFLGGYRLDQCQTSSK